MLKWLFYKKHCNPFLNLFLGTLLYIFCAILLSPVCHAQIYSSNGAYYPSAPYYTETSFKGPFLRFGMGYGIPYGYFGVNTEFMLFKYISMTGGMGYSPGGSSWIMGVRVYMNEPERHFRPRISTLYGTVSVLSRRYGPEETYENDQGYAYGIGFEWKVLDPKKYSLDFDIILTDYDVPPGYEKKGPEIKFSIGFGRVF